MTRWQVFKLLFTRDIGAALELYFPKVEPVPVAPAAPAHGVRPLSFNPISRRMV
jgi:hypothetical protein